MKTSGTHPGDGVVPAGEPHVATLFTAIGLPAVIQRALSGVLCGYVAVPADHPWYGKPYSWLEMRLTVHGGVSYASRRLPTCSHPHDPEAVGNPWAEEGLWWVGFDAGHALDRVPSLQHDFGTYRDLAYMERQARDLWAQIHSEDEDDTPDEDEGVEWEGCSSCNQPIDA